MIRTLPATYSVVMCTFEKRVVAVIGLGSLLDLIIRPFVASHRTLTLSLPRLMEHETPHKVFLKAVTKVVSF